MTPLPGALGGNELVAWRLDQATLAGSWDSGEGAYGAGGRWNGKGVRAVYCSIDPATAVLEVAVHTGFKALDTVPHVLTSMTIAERSSVYVVEPTSVPNPNWLRPGIPSAGQQAFGTALLAWHKFIVIPSAVSTHSWNLIFVRTSAAGAYAVKSQEPFALDPRLHPTTTS
ncbi:MAG: RES family NAD+ phosphorylase [Alphaproteobacteria bacterium]|nr:RES domain-containing protein [Alphaproteobacteria bacterium]